LDGKDAPGVVTAVPAPLTVTEMVLPEKFETPQPATCSCVLKQKAPVVLKLPELPPVLTLAQSPPLSPPELLLDEELDELELLLEDDELLEDEDEDEELLLEELLLEELLDDELPLPPPSTPSGAGWSSHVLRATQLWLFS
jgi:hypothetical protein